MLDNLAVAIWREETEMARSLRDVIENTYMADVDDVAYDVAIIRYNPVERYKDGRINETEVVASYRKAAP